MEKDRVLRVTFKEQPELFDDIEEFSIERNEEHRRGSNFWLEHIIEFTSEDSQYFKDVPDFNKYIGFWKTNQVIWDADYGMDDSFSELTRVEKRVKVVETVEYVVAKN